MWDSLKRMVYQFFCPHNSQGVFGYERYCIAESHYNQREGALRS